MGNKNNIVLCFSLMIVITTTLSVWYSDFNTKKIKNCSDVIHLTDVEANKVLLNFDDSKRYYYETKSLVELTKTVIPFVYTKKIIKKYPRDILSQNKP